MHSHTITPTHTPTDIGDKLAAAHITLEQAQTLLYKLTNNLVESHEYPLWCIIDELLTKLKEQLHDAESTATTAPLPTPTRTALDVCNTLEHVYNASSLCKSIAAWAIDQKPVETAPIDWHVGDVLNASVLAVEQLDALSKKLGGQS